MTQDTVVVTQSARDAAHRLCLGEKVGGGDGGTYVLRTPRISDVEQAIAAAEQRGFKLCQDAAVKAVEEYDTFDRDTAISAAQASVAIGITERLRTLSMETGNAE